MVENWWKEKLFSSREPILLFLLLPIHLQEVCTITLAFLTLNSYTLTHNPCLPDP
jgi:hypothetical protein